MSLMMVATVMTKIIRLMMRRPSAQQSSALNGLPSTHIVPWLYIMTITTQTNQPSCKYHSCEICTIRVDCTPFVRYMYHSCSRCAHKYPDGSFCQTTFTKYRGLRRHVKEMHEREEKNEVLKCDQCPADSETTFHSNAALKLHQKEIHGEGGW